MFEIYWALGQKWRNKCSTVIYESGSCIIYSTYGDSVHIHHLVAGRGCTHPSAKEIPHWRWEVESSGPDNTNPEQDFVSTSQLHTLWLWLFILSWSVEHTSGSDRWGGAHLGCQTTQSLPWQTDLPKAIASTAYFCLTCLTWQMSSIHVTSHLLTSSSPAPSTLGSSLNR